MDIWDLLYPRDERWRPLHRIIRWLLTVAALAFLALTPFLREGMYPPFGQRYPGQYVPQTTEGKLAMGVALVILVLVVGWLGTATRRGRR